MHSFIDGLLQGHEGTPFKVAYRMWMFTFIIFSIFSGLCNIPLLTHEGSHPAYPMISLMIIGLLVYTLMMVRAWKDDGLDPKFRRWIFALMVFVLVLDIASAMIFHDTISYKAPVREPYPAPEPSTEAPTVEPTPSPNGTDPGNDTTTAASRWRNFEEFQEWRRERLAEQKAEAEEKRRKRAATKNPDTTLPPPTTRRSVRRESDGKYVFESTEQPSQPGARLRRRRQH
jgi:hypothetical protein